jgi:hypothetical protein
MLTRKHASGWDTLLVVDDKQDMALSMAYGIVDALGYRRSESIYVAGSDYKAQDKGPVPLPYVYETTRAGRVMVCS